MPIIKKNQQYLKNQLWLVIVLLIIGGYFRFANLPAKVFWVDEIATAVRVAGYTIPEVSDRLTQSELLEFDDLIVYQRISPERTFRDSWDALLQSPEHTPLYFVLTRLWMSWWGSSITVMRSFAACLSLLIFPALYWLGQELFAHRAISRIAVMLMAVSPFYVNYSQEARPYSLWTLTILLTSASLLRGIRLKKWRWWWLYSCCLVLGFYTSLFSIYVAIFQGIYLLLAPLQSKAEVMIKYLVSSIVASLIFAPWLWNIIRHLDLFQTNTSWMRGNFNLTEIIAVFIGTVLLIFGDLPISQDAEPVQMAVVLMVIVTGVLLTLILSRGGNRRWLKFASMIIVATSLILLSKYIYLDLVSIVGAIVALFILSISAYSLYYLITHTQSDRWLFVYCLIFSLPTPLLITDIINQGQSSTAPRYLIPLQLGIQIAVAYTLTKKLQLSSKVNIWRLVTVFLLILGIFSGWRNRNLSPFYQKGRNINNPAIAQIINRADSPLVVVESANGMDALSLAYSLSPHTKYKVINSDRDFMPYRDRFTSIFLLKPSTQLIQKLQTTPQVSLTQVYQSHLFSADEVPLDLWQIRSSQ